MGMGDLGETSKQAAGTENVADIFRNTVIHRKRQFLWDFHWSLVSKCVTGLRFHPKYPSPRCWCPSEEVTWLSYCTISVRTVVNVFWWWVTAEEEKKGEHWHCCALALWMEVASEFVIDGVSGIIIIIILFHGHWISADETGLLAGWTGWGEGRAERPETRLMFLFVAQLWRLERAIPVDNYKFINLSANRRRVP